MDSTYHVDRVDAPRWMTSPFTKTPEGFLSGRAVVTTTGVFTYLDAKGKTIRELRLPEEVFKQSFLDSLKMKPVTLDHPKELVTPENVKKYAVGTMGNNPSDPWNGTSDNYNLSIDMIITDAEAIKAVESGKRQLSIGYNCDLEAAEPGAMWCGQGYDFIQRNLVANHVSIVDRARAGDTAMIRMDSAEAHIQVVEDSGNAQGDKENSMADKQYKMVKLDGVDFEAEAEVAVAFNKNLDRLDALQSELDTLKSDKSKIEAERDAQKEKLDSLTAELEEAKKNKFDASQIAEMVKARAKLEAVAVKAGVVVEDGMDDLAVKTAVVKAKAPKANLDGKDEIYIQARFDGIVEDMSAESQESSDANNRAPAGVPKVDGQGEPKKADAKSYAEKLKDACNVGKKKEK